MSTEKRFTLDQAATKLGITPSLVRRYLRNGRLSGRKFGHVWEIPAAALEEFRKLPRKPGPRKSEKTAKSA